MSSEVAENTTDVNVEEIKENTEGKVKDKETKEQTEEVYEPVNNPKAVIESILFAMGDSVEYKKIACAIGRTVEETKEIVGDMQNALNDDPDRGVTIIELDDKIQMCSKTEMYEYLIRVAKVPRNLSLTDTVLETLSIIAFKQPVTRAEIEKIRGVSSDHAVNKLLEYGLVCELGRLNAPGRPLLFGTTEEFLRSFGVKSIDDLPSIAPDRLEEFKEEAAKEAQLKLDI